MCQSRLVNNHGIPLCRNGNPFDLKRFLGSDNRRSLQNAVHIVFQTVRNILEWEQRCLIESISAQIVR